MFRTNRFLIWNNKSSFNRLLICNSSFKGRNFNSSFYFFPKEPQDNENIPTLRYILNDAGMKDDELEYIKNKEYIHEEDDEIYVYPKFVDGSTRE